MYPINLLLDNCPCLIIGGGSVAFQKAKGLLAANAVVTVLAPEICPQLQDLVQAGQIIWQQRPYTPGAEAGYTLLLCCAGDSTANAAAAKAALARGQLVNVCDKPEESNWTTPSVIRRGPLLCTISTNGQAPAFSRWLRLHWEEKLTPAYGKWIERLAAVRAEAQSSLTSNQARQTFWRQALTDDIMALVAEGDQAAAEALLRQKLQHFCEEVQHENH